MNFKTKTFAFVAGTAFALSSALGVSAQDPTTTAELGDNEKTGTCRIDLTAGKDVSFGSYTWDGEHQQYVADDAENGSNSGTIFATVTQDRSSQDITCFGSMTGTNLTIGETTGGGISNELISVSGNIGDQSLDFNTLDTGVSYSGPVSRQGVTGNIVLTLDERLDTAYVPGTYTGELEITVSESDL